MELISPQRAAQALGVSESSLKRWCDAGLIPVVRTVGGHRKLATSDLVRFAGEQNRPLVAPAVLGLPRVRDRSVADLTRLRPEFVEALLSGDEPRAWQIVLDLFLAKHSPAVICDELIAGAFREIGELWSCREAEVYQERRGCEIVVRILHELRRLHSTVSGSPTALCATASGDHYLIPAAMAETILFAAGFAAAPLGHDIPSSSLVYAVDRLKPDLLCLGVSTLNDEAEFVAGIELLTQACERRQTVLVLGGRALHSALRARLKYPVYCDSMRQLEALARAFLLRSNRRPRPARTKTVRIARTRRG